MPLTLLISAFATVAMFAPLLIRSDLSKTVVIAPLIALSSVLAGLSTFGYAEVIRDQFPPAGQRRSDVP